jgi:hypothetical protein
MSEDKDMFSESEMEAVKELESRITNIVISELEKMKGHPAYSDQHNIVAAALRVAMAKFLFLSSGLVEGHSKEDFLEKFLTQVKEMVLQAHKAFPVDDNVVILKA